MTSEEFRVGKDVSKNYGETMRGLMYYGGGSGLRDAYARVMLCIGSFEAIGRENGVRTFATCSGRPSGIFDELLYEI